MGDRQCQTYENTTMQHIWVDSLTGVDTKTPQLEQAQSEAPLRRAPWCY